MADIQSNINVNINTSEALASIRTLQRQISAFYESMARSGAAASAAASNMQNNLINTINQTGKFSASIKTIASTTEAFTTSLEKNKLSMGQYFKFAGGASKTFGKFFKTEMDTIDKVARERVKTLQTQYIKLGRDASGALKSIAIRPLTLDMKDLGTQTAIAAQKQQLMNQLLKQGSTNLLNFGKNTQWAGRQLMVGFTIPLAMVGTAAAKTFMKMEEQAIKFKRVYGDSMTPTGETDAMVKQIRELATEFTKYGVAAEKTMELAATAAAAGKQGLELTAQVREANRLAVLGQVEQQEALSTTISITNAFGIAADQLAKKIDFLNAVENQTVTSIEDLTIAVPKAGPVVKQLGGDVEDLAFFLTAMKEGGINASEGANALKSGLAALINPTGKAADMLASFGINVKGIVEANKGDVKGLVVDFAKALDTLDPLSRARAIEQLFGKFQFSRLSTLFQNVIAEGTQASRVLELTGRSASDLAALSSKELGTVAASSMFKFQKAVEELKMALAPIGEIFLKLITPLLEFGSKVLENFNKLDAGAKNFIVGLIAVVGGLGPVLIMTFGLLANGIANIIKGFMLVRNIFTKSGDSSRYLGDQTEYMTQQQLEAAGVAASLEQVHQRLEQRFTSEAIAVDKLTQALQRANNANLTYMGRNTGAAGAKPKKYAKGVVSVPGPKGAGDIIPAMLSPGEAVIPSKQAAKYAALIQGIVADNLPGYKFSNVDTSGSSQALGRPKRGGGQNVSVPGAYEQAHFDPQNSRSMTIRQIREMLAEQNRVLSKNAQTVLTEIMQVSGEGLDTVVRVWTDKVIMLKRDLHTLFTSNNPGEKKPPVAVSLVKEKLETGGLGTHAKMYEELRKLGVSEEEAKQKVAAIQNELIATLDKLPEGATLVADEFDKLVQSAYDTIAKVDVSVKEAQDRMGRITTFQDRFTKDQIRRVSLGAGDDAGYNADKVAQQTRISANKLSDGLIPTSAAMKITGDLELATKKTSDQIVAALKQLPDSIRVRLASIRMDPEAFAQEFLAAVDEFGVSFDVAATKISSKIKKATSRVNSETIDGTEQGLNEAIQRNSPPKEAIKIGRDYGFALNGALREMIPKAKVAGEAFGLTATTGMTTVTPAMRQHLMDSAGRILRPYLDAQTTIIPIAKQKVEILDEEARAARRAADAIRQKNIAVQQEASQEILAAGAIQSGNAAEAAEDMQDLSRSIVPVETGLARFGSGLRNSSFVITSLAAAGTMAGGEIGEMSSKIMQFSGIIFAATTVIDLLVAAQRRQIAATTAATLVEGAKAKTGFLATIMNFLSFSSGGALKKAGGLGFLASLKNAILPLSIAFKSASGGIRGFFNAVKFLVPVLLNVVKTAASFIPVIGQIVLGITAMVLIVDEANKAKERERLATEGVADAMQKAKDAIPGLSELLGKAKTSTLAERLAQGAESTDSKEKVSLVTSLTTGEQSEEFKKQFGELIESMKSMSKAEIEMQQNSLAVNLQSTGQYAQEEIESIIKALQIKAGTTDVVFQFKSIDITSKNSNGFKLAMEKISNDLQNALNSGADETRVTEALKTTAKAYGLTFEALNDALYNGVINAEEYDNKMKAVTGTILASSKAQEITKEMMQEFTDVQLASRPAMASLANNLKRGSDRMFVMQGVASSAIPDLIALTEVISALNTVAAFEAGDTSIDKAMYQKALDTKLKFEKIAAAKSAQIAAGNKEPGTDTGGTKEKSPFEVATEQIRNQIKEISNANKAFNGLQKAGLTAADAFKIAKDPALAAALATTKVGTEKWKELVLLTKQYVAAIKTGGLNDTLKNLKIDNETLSNFDKLGKYLLQMGLSSEDVQSVISNPELAEQLMYATGEGEKGFAKIKNYIAYILKNKELKMTIGIDLIDQFKAQIGKVNEEFSRKENALQLKFKIDTKADKSIVAEAEKQIKTLNFQADDFEAGLTRLESGEEAINEKYDNRIEALDKIISANDRIADQNKEELNIFQMVARGDIAGAAAGIAELQQQKAKNALEAKKESLQAQRTNELESLTAEVMVNGQKVRMTRNQIEENLKNIKEQIFNIEENSLEPAQRNIDLAQDRLDLDIEALDVLGLTALEWEQIGINVDAAKAKTTTYVTELERALNIAKQIPGALAGTSKSSQEIVGKPDIISETQFPGNEKLGKPKPNPTPGSGLPPQTAVIPQPGDPGFVGPVAPKDLPFPPNYQKFQEAMTALVEEEKDWRGKNQFLQAATFIPHTQKTVGLYETISSGMESGYAWALQRFGPKNALREANNLSILGTSDFWNYYTPNLTSMTPKQSNIFKKYKPMFDSASKFAVGGKVKGPGTGTSDSIPALLSNGEYVIRANAVKALGTDTLDRMNYADKNRFANGGSVGRQEAAMAARGGAKSKSNPLADIAKAIFFAPLDMAKDFNRSIGNVLTGKGDGLDYLSLASALPAGRVTSSASKILKSLSTKKAPLGVGVKEISGVEPLLNPNDSLVKSLVTGNLLHGSQAQTAKEFAIKSSGGSKKNWFKANAFSTGSMELAESYGDYVYKIDMPVAQAKNLKILDLYPGAKPIEQQFPGIVDILKSKGVAFNKIEGLKDIALATKSQAGAKFINRPDRHKTLADAMDAMDPKQSKQIRDILTKKFGIDAIRHQSGHNNQFEKLHSEVFAFFNPKNTKAKYTGNIEANELESAAEDALVQKWLDQARSARKKAKGGLVRYADGGFVDRRDAAMAGRGGTGSQSNPLMATLKSIFFAPLDMAKEFNSSIGNVLTGKGQGGDFLNVASALPIGKGASLLGKGFGAVKSLIKNRPGSIESMLNRSVIATRMPHDTLLQMLRTGDTKYRTAFETGTGADFITQTGHLAGKPDPYNKRMRHAMEEYAFAIDYKKNTLEQRPTYGLMATVGPINKALNAISGGKYAKRFNELTNPMNTKLDLYGDISLISNKKVPKRSQFYAGDLRNAYYQNDAHFMYRKTQGINFPPMRGASQAEIAGNPSGFLADKVKPLNIGDSVQFAPYIEAYTRGGFDLSEISKILVSNPNILKTLPQELKKSGLDIPVKLYPGIRSKEILFKTLDFLADIEDKVRGKNTLKLDSQDMPKFADGGFVDRRDAAMAARGGAKSKSNPIADIAKSIFFAPLDMAKDFNKSIGNVFTGKGDGLDYLNLASALPIGKLGTVLGKGANALKGLAPAPKGNSIENVLGTTPLANPNASLIKSVISGQALHGTMAKAGSGLKPPKSFEVSSGGGSSDNWFGADFFTTGSKQLAQTYGSNIYRAKMPVSQAKDIKILDFTPGAPPMEQQFPGLLAKLNDAGMYTNQWESLENIALTKEPKILQSYLNNPTRHLPFTRGDTANILKEFGIGAIRHLSGQGNTAGERMASEVFAFFDPKNIKAVKNFDPIQALYSAKLGIKSGMNSVSRSMLNPKVIAHRFKLLMKYGPKDYNFFTGKLKNEPFTGGVLAKGGLVSPKILKNSKNFAMGGMVMRSPEAPPMQMAMGGMVAPKYFANGGMVMPKYFAKGGDVVPAMLTPGEFVMTKHAVDNYGVDNLKAINSGAAPGNSVYNGYNINVNVRSNSNPDQIANAVMTQIRQVNAQQVRGSKF